jgi:hypothetical protein
LLADEARSEPSPTRAATSHPEHCTARRALVVNFVVLIAISFAVRAFASPHRVVHSR